MDSHQIQKVLTEIQEYYQRNRQKGHTYAVKNGARFTYRALVVVPNLHAGKNLYDKSEFITFYQIAQGDLRRVDDRPLVFDNYAIQMLCRESLNAMEVLCSNENEQLQSCY